MKLCTSCKQMKPENEFTTSKVHTDNLTPYCKSCKKEYDSEYKRDNYINVLYNSCKGNAKRRGIPFTITHDDIVIPTVCPILGIPLKIMEGSKDYRPSIERVDNTKGYVKDNIVVISFRANRIKSDASLEELEAITSFVRNFHGLG